MVRQQQPRISEKDEFREDRIGKLHIKTVFHRRLRKQFNFQYKIYLFCYYIKEVNTNV